MRRGHKVLAAGLGALLLAAVALALVLLLNRLGEAPLPTHEVAVPATPEVIARGAYLARVGNCAGCHTAPGGEPYAGGRGIDTPFGTVYAPNLTPHEATGLGSWTAAHFWRAMHNGRSRDGRLLYPAFPYLNYTHVTREDVDAIFAYLRSLPAVDRATPPHALRFPFDTQAALAVWRALFFRPGGPPQPAPAQTVSAPLDRGAYLVQGLGHCAACHTPRNAWGAPRAGAALGGGMIPLQGWYAPALDVAQEAGVADWPLDEVVELLRTGTTPRAGASGPMAAVVFQSLQHWSEADLRATAQYLQALPQRAAPPVRTEAAAAAEMELGGKLYEQHCAQCHGARGEGGEGGAFPPLAGNRAVLLREPTNLVRVVLQGGYLPATAGNPRPHGMPPFTQVLTDREIAAVLSFIRSSWGNQAGKVDTITVHRARERRGSWGRQ